MQIGFGCAKPEQGDDYWEIWAYPAVQEIVGGKEDGETVWSGFNFDVLEFLNDFEPEAVAISTRQHIHPSELTFEGKFRGKGVFLHLCLEPPEDTEATEIVDLSGTAGRWCVIRSDLPKLIVPSAASSARRGSTRLGRPRHCWGGSWT